MHIGTLLQNAGLNERESSIYEALLELGPSSVLQIAKKTGMKRPTVYLVIDELVKKGYVSLVPKETRKLYIALSPERIFESLQQRTRAFGDALPSLLGYYQGQTEKPTIKFTESRDGIMNIYREITKKKSSSELIAFVSPDTVPTEFDDNWDMFVKLFENPSVKGREIVSADSMSHPYLKATKRFRNYEARYVTADNSFPSDTVVYGNKIALFSFKKGFALVIESSDIADSMRSIFNLAWNCAQKV